MAEMWVDSPVTPLGPPPGGTEHCICFPCDRVVHCSNYCALPVLFPQLSERRAGPCPNGSASHLAWYHVWLPQCTRVGGWGPWTAGITLPPTVVGEAPSCTQTCMESIRLWFLVSWVGHQFAPTSFPLTQLLFEKKKTQTFISLQNWNGSNTGCFTYVISLILTK